MRHTNEQIRANIREFVEMTKQPEIYHVIPFCFGYYGHISKQVWDEIYALALEGVVKLDA